MLFQERPGLLHGFRTGQRDALEQVYLRYVNELLLLAKHGFTLRGPPPVRISGIGDPTERMDLVQEVFARAFAPKARQSYDGERPYRAYLFSVARNLWVDRARKAGRERPLDTASDEEGVPLDDLIDRNAPPPPAGLEERLDARREREATAAYLRSLDEQARRYVQLRFEDELSQLAAARELGLSRREARTLEERVHAGLKRHLARTKSGQTPSLVGTEG
jgi:RNA polymerase sigma factor (sigma-70 family)